MPETTPRDFQLLLFDDITLPPAPREPEQGLLLELFSSLAAQKTVKIQKTGVDGMPWKRHQAVIKAAVYHPKRSIDAVMKAFLDYSQGDKRPEVLDHFLVMYLRRAQDRPVKLEKFLDGIEKRMARAQIPTLDGIIRGQ